jgi:hypothetical protein
MATKQSQRPMPRKLKRQEYAPPSREFLKRMMVKGWKVRQKKG